MKTVEERSQAREEQQKEQASENAKRIQYITAAASTLRGRTDHLLSVHDHHDVPYEAVEATLEKINSLIAELRPTAEIATEFRQKWDKQKQALTEQRESEIERYLLQESEAVSRRAETACEEELASMKREEDAQAESSIEERTRCHEPVLRKAVGHWRHWVQGAEQVRQGAVDESIRHALERIAQWTGDEERYLMQHWDQELSKHMADIHHIDEECFAAMENMHKARCAVMEATMQRQQKDLLAFRNEYQEQIAKVAEKTLRLPQDAAEKYWKDDGSKASKNRRPPASSSPLSATPKALEKVVQSRMTFARTEAAAASEAHARNACESLAEIAMKEQERLLVFRSAIEKVGPQLAKQLEDEFCSMTKAAADAAEARQSEANRVFTKGTSVRPGVRAQGLVPGRRGQVHEERERAAVQRVLTDGDPRHPRILDHSMDEEGSLFERGDEMCVRASDDSALGERDDDLNRAQREQIVGWRQKLKATQEAAVKTDWVEYRKEIAEVADKGHQAVKAAEEAFEAQARVMKAPTLNDSRGISSIAGRLMKHSEDYAANVRNEFVRVRNTKVALCRARAAYAREAQQQQNWDVVEFEEDILPAMSKLAHEAETAVEVGHSLKRGVERIPICVICGAWRRAIVASLPILKHLWDGAHIDKAEREEFVSKLFDTLLRAPGVAQQFESQTASAQAQLALRGLVQH